MFHSAILVNLPGWHFILVLHVKTEAANGHAGLPGSKAHFLPLCHSSEPKSTGIATFYLEATRCHTLFYIIPNPHRDTVKFLFFFCVVEETKDKKGLELQSLNLF